MSLKKAIADTLREDDTLLNMLTENRPFYSDQTDSASTENSIVPFGLVPDNFKTPYITIQGGEKTLRETKLFDEIIYIQATNDEKKSFVKIDEICERIKTLLDGEDLSIDNVLIKLIWEFTGPELNDEELQQNYREMRFRVLQL